MATEWNNRRAFCFKSPTQQPVTDVRPRPAPTARSDGLLKQSAWGIRAVCQKSIPAARHGRPSPLALTNFWNKQRPILPKLGHPQWIVGYYLSGVLDLWDRNKILRCGDLSHLLVPDCIWVFFYFVWFVFIHHSFQFYFEWCTYCNILDIDLLWNLNYVNYLLFYMKLLNYLFWNMFGSVLECYELTGVSLLWTRRALANKAKIGLAWKKIGLY